MSSRILLTYITFLLFFTISFSTKYHRQKNIIHCLENEIVPKISKIYVSSFKLYDFLIYPSNGCFKYAILPFISSSENLLEIFFHFQKLHPAVNLEKFLPYSTIKTSVLDLNDSLFAYIFQDEYKSFNPILYSQNNYKTCNINDDKNINEDSIFAFFSSNKIFSLETYVLQNNENVYAGFDEENEMFFVAIKTDQGKLIPISHGVIKSKIKFPDYLECILEAHNLNCFSKIYFSNLSLFLYV
jgi:hypothetical protein